MATATTAVTPRRRSMPTMTRTRLIIRRVAQRPDQAGGDQDDDQQRDPVEDDRDDAATAATAQPGTDHGVDRHRGEEATEDQADQQQGVPKIWVHFDSVDR